MGVRSTFGCASIGGLLLWAALPPLDLWPLAWIAPSAWLLLIRRRELPGPRPYGALWLVGFLFWLAALHWLRLPHWTSAFGWVALACYLGVYLPAFVGLTRIAVHQLRVPVILAAPLVWTGLELARGHLLGGFTMASLGHTQYRWLALIQLSDLAGAYGVSFVVMLVAACLARMFPCEGTRWAIWPLLPGAAVVAAAVLYGHVRMSGQYTSPGERIALIQGSVDTEVKFDPRMQSRVFNEYFDLSRQAVAENTDVALIVWPETMFRQGLIDYDADARKPPAYEDLTENEFRVGLRVGRRYSRGLAQWTAEVLHTPLILGVDAYHYSARGVRCYNTAIYVDSQGTIVGRYDKIHPVLFGEYVPLGERFPWLHRLLPLGINLTAGSRPAVFTVGRLRISPNICYETVLPHVIRHQVNTAILQGEEPNVLVNLTNDGWFWGSSELDLHLACGVFRAIECRKPLLIAANTGFSAWIDGDGWIVKQGPRRATEVIVADVQLDHRRSWYLRHGDWAAGVCLAVCVVFLIAGCIGRFRRKGA